MVWTEEKLAQLTTRNVFRLRGENMTRLEVFSDAAFAFALTMLVVSVGSVPENYGELIDALKSIPAFCMSFAQLAAFWLAHRIWSSQYGLEDKTSTILTLVMIFTILVFVYPLRLIFSSFASFVSGGWLPSDFTITSLDELAGLFVVYGVGYATLSAVVTLLYFHAYRRRTELCLNERELLSTQHGLYSWGIQVGFALVSAMFALLAPQGSKSFAGFIYFGLAIAMPLVSIKFAKKINNLSQVTDS